MTRLPRHRGKEVVSALLKHGFEVSRVKGSHYHIRHSDGRSTTVPVHTGETIGPGLMSKILKDCELTSEDITSVL